VDPAEKVSAIIADTVKALGLDLVRVTYGGGRKPTLQIMAERPDGSMSVEDCAILSREVSALLDVEDPIAGEFLLEVSSPGIDRPLTRAKDFERWAGFDVKVELHPSLDETRRRYKGRLHGVEDGSVLLTPVEETEVVRLSLDDINKAKLLLTDELLRAAENNFKGYPAERMP